MNQKTIKILQQFSLCNETHQDHVYFYMPDLYRSSCSSECNHINHCKLCKPLIHHYEDYNG